MSHVPALSLGRGEVVEINGNIFTIEKNIQSPDIIELFSVEFTQPGQRIGGNLGTFVGSRADLESQVEANPNLTLLAGQLQGARVVSEGATVEEQGAGAQPPPGTAIGTQLTSLVDIWNARPDLQQEFPTGTQAGSADNARLNDWWNTVGRNEYPNTELVPPGDSRAHPTPVHPSVSGSGVF